MSVEIIAEIGMNHDGSLPNARRMAEVAIACGATTVKFQTHIAEAETLKGAPMPPYFTGEPRFEYFSRTAFSEDQWSALRLFCEEKGAKFLSSPFSFEAVTLLEKVGVDSYKIPSGEVTNLPLIARVAETRKRVILSSGMSSWEELDAAVQTVQKVHSNLVVLQCTSEYPCAYEHVGLNLIFEMKARYKLPVGLSDHTLTNFASFAAVSAGATVIERHFTLSKNLYGSDAKHSLEPAEFTELCAGVRAIEVMLKSPVDKSDISRFKDMKRIFEKSIVSVCDIAPGERITAENIALKKPGGGLPPSRYLEVLSKTAKRKIPKDTALQDGDIS